MEGKVVRLMAAKGFGFIHGEDNKDYFFHKDSFRGFFEDLIKDVEMGAVIKVTFDPFNSPKGLRAGDVTRIDGGVGNYT